MICTACYSNFPKAFFGPLLEHLSWMKKIQKMGKKRGLRQKQWQRGDGGALLVLLQIHFYVFLIICWLLLQVVAASFRVMSCW